MRNPWRRGGIGLLSFLLVALAAGVRAESAARAERLPPKTLWLAELQVWHHPERSADAPYDSRNPVVIARQIASAKARGISGFVIDWYGPAAGLANDADRAFQDEATAAVFAEAEAQGFWVALLYDEGTLRSAPGREREQATADIQYAQKYFGRKAYLKLAGKPALFVFPYPEVDPKLDWAAVRASLGTAVSLIDQNPNPQDPAHDANFDGFFAWIQPSSSGWAADCSEWGRDYLDWFYSTMAADAYAGKITVGGAWPGFDDTLASWGSNRCMSRRGDHVWNRTTRLALKANAPVVMIATYNDVAEGSDIEFGVWMDVNLDADATQHLVRSSPLRVRWDERRGPGVLQVYKDGSVIYQGTHSPGVWLGLKPETLYEIKVWTPDTPPLGRWVKTRKVDPVPGVTPIQVE